LRRRIAGRQAAGRAGAVALASLFGRLCRVRGAPQLFVGDDFETTDVSATLARDPA
jgi:uncharacterized protein with PIN domain